MSPRAYRLLAVDDEPLALNLINRVFETEADIEVLSTTSPLRAVEMAAAGDIDLVIADQRMPELTGLELLARLRELRPRALRFLLTAFPDTAVALKAINEDLVYRFVLKPWDPEEMRVTVRRALEAKRLADEHERLVAELQTGRTGSAAGEHRKALGRLSAGIGHELGNVVAVLVERVGALEKALRGAAPAEASIAAVRESAQQLEALAADMKGSLGPEGDAPPDEPGVGQCRSGEPAPELRTRRKPEC